MCALEIRKSRKKKKGTWFQSRKHLGSQNNKVVKSSPGSDFGQVPISCVTLSSKLHNFGPQFPQL